MTTHYSSKHGQVAKRPEELYMVFCDMSNFANMVNMLPEKFEVEITAEYDYLSITIHGFKIGIRVDERRPYSLVRLGSSDSPVEFVADLHFGHSETPGKTDFSIEMDANLNLMMRSMLGPKIQQVLDKIVDGLVKASEGRMPDIPEDAFRK